MTVGRQAAYRSRARHTSSPADQEPSDEVGPGATTYLATVGLDTEQSSTATAISAVRKAAIVLVSLDHSLASQLLSHLDRTAVEAITWEIARLEGVDTIERAAVLEEFYSLGLRRFCFVFDDLVRMTDHDLRDAFHLEDVDMWALALAGAAAPVRAKVLGALSASAANQLHHDLDHLGPFRLSDSESAQLEITERLRRLYDLGRISLPEPSDRDDVLV
jgi:flagellar motor switch protein FliG